MPDSDGYPAWVSEICERVVARLAAIKAIRAVALGGSRARGTAREDSDIDLALYYDRSTPFPIEQLNAAARELDDRHADGLVTPPGAWGPGVNGGGWLLIGGRHVDFLYRDLRRVREVVDGCIRGQIDAVYQLGHPIGFQNQIYAGETHFCRPLYAGRRARRAQEARCLIPSKHATGTDRQAYVRCAIRDRLGPAGRGDVAYV